MEDTLTKDEVKKLLKVFDRSLSPQEESNIDNFYKSHKKEQEELRNMISQEEIDALLGGVTDDSKRESENVYEEFKDWASKQGSENGKYTTVSPDVESSHIMLDMFFQAAKSDITQAMEVLHKESQQILSKIKDGIDNETLAKNTQNMLGTYYTFLSTCHDELKRLDRIIEHEKKVYSERVRLESE